jgi:hypothetical protein
MSLEKGGWLSGGYAFEIKAAGQVLGALPPLVPHICMRESKVV